MFLGVGYKDTPESLAGFLQQTNPYRQVFLDQDGRMALEFGVKGTPETFVVTRAGVVVAHHIGRIDASVWQNKLMPWLVGHGE